MAQTNILLESGTNELEIVEFLLHEIDDAGQTYVGHYGVNVAKVLEIIRMPHVTEIPNTSHKAVMGAFTLRSNVIPLVDLNVWLGKRRPENEDSKVIVTEFNRVTTAFRVSGVNRIHRLSWEDVEAPNRYVTSLSADSITGVVKIESRIIFILDLEKIVTDLNPGMRMRLEAPKDKELAKYRALVAEDSAMVRNMMLDLLEKAGFLVETAKNGEEAWERLQAISQASATDGKPLKEYVQAVISDIEMPRMDGHSLTKRIKDDPVLKALPVVLFSSLITEKLRHKGESVGADDQVSKPEVGTLATRTRQLIEERMV